MSMSYFKIIDKDEIVGVITSDDFRIYQQKHNIILMSDSEHGQFVEYDGAFYRDNWMRRLPDNCSLRYTHVSVVGINEDEYLALQESDSKNVEEQSFDDGESVVQDVDETQIEYLKKVKISDMRRACGLAITDGFDIVLNDKKSHHFSLTVQDQINLLDLASRVLSGQTEILYHADGETCRYFSDKEISMITNKASEHKLYQEVYFNSLKSYINSLNSVEAITAITYGCEIPNEFKNDYIK